MKELVQEVKQWGINKELDKVGHLAQAEYTLKETAELLDAYADSDIDAINDAIGDILVTLIVGASNDDKAYDELIGMLLCETVYGIRPINQRDFYRNYIDLLSSIFILKENIEHHSSAIGNLYIHCVCALIDVLAWANHNYAQVESIQDCLQLAYNEIKDRTGHTDENGHFIKDN